MPAVVRFSETAAGKATLLVIFALLLRTAGLAGWSSVALGLVGPTFFPTRRRELLTLATLVVLALGGTPLVPPPTGTDPVDASRLALESPYGRVALAVAVFALAAGFCRLAADRPRLLRRPVLALVLIDLGGLAIAGSGSLSGPARTCVAGLALTFNAYLWFIAYSVADATKGPPFLPQLAGYRPFWGGGRMPIPKAGSALDQAEAKTPEALAVAQLKGVKLALWALLLTIALRIVAALVHGHDCDLPRPLIPGFDRALARLPTLGMPTLEDAIASSASGRPLPAPLAWIALIVGFVVKLGRTATLGALIVAPCRVAGFQALRYTYRPLEARTVAEFWNRVAYYFKELLVAFFFFPIYVRFLKRRPRARLVLATFAAAGLGNFLFHLLGEPEAILREGLLAAAWNLRVYAFYVTVLAAAIAVSQLRSRAAPRDAVPTRFARARSTTLVLGFYGLLSVFDEPHGGRALSDHLGFVANLFRWGNA
jgi:hypothetical protein